MEIHDSFLGWHWAEINALVVWVPSAGFEDKAVPCPLWVSVGGPQPLAFIGMLILHSNLSSHPLLEFCFCVFSLLFK